MYELKDQSRIDSLTSAAQAALCRVLADSPTHEDQVTDMRLERYWPGKRGGASFEWSFNTGPDSRVKVFGLLNAKTSDCHGAGGKDARIERGWLTGVCTLAGENLLLHSADRDARLPQLSDCVSPDHMGRVLGEHVGDAFFSDEALSPTVLNYRPGRRAVVMYRSAESDAGETSRHFVGKVFRDGRGAELMKQHRQVGEAIQERTGGRVVVIQPKSYIPQWNMLLMPHIESVAEGVGKTGVLGNKDWAGVLTTLHSVDVPGLPAFTERDELMVIDRWLNLLERLCTNLPVPVPSMRSALALWSQKLSISDIVTAHRDFYPAQVIPTGRASVLIDLDTLALGSPGIDLGNLACHLLLDRAAANEGVDCVQMLKDMRSAYIEAGGRVGIDELAFFTVTSLLRVGTVHCLRATTAEQAPALWRHATTLLRAYGPACQGFIAEGPASPAFSRLVNEEAGL